MKKILFLGICFVGILHAMYSSDSDDYRPNKKRKIDGEEQLIPTEFDQSDMDQAVEQSSFDLEKDQPLKKKPDLKRVSRNLFSDNE